MKITKLTTKMIIFFLILQLYATSSSTTSAIITDQFIETGDVTLSKQILQISDLEWKYGKFERNWTNPFIAKTGGGYECDINKTTIHMKETGTESYNSQLTCYTLVELDKSKIALSFEYKAKSINPEECDFLFYLVDPSTNISLKYPKIEYPKWYPGLEAGFNQASIETVLEGFQQILLVFICRDDSPINDEQEFWVQKFKYYVSGELPNTFPHSYSSFKDLTWKVGLYGWYPTILPEFPDPIAGYSYEITDSQMYFEETGTGAYKQWIGASTILNTKGRYFSISYDAKIERDLGYNGNFWIFYYDATTREIIFTTQAGMNLGDYDSTSDTGWIHFEHKIDFKDYDNVIILFTHIDVYPSNINHKFWVSNLKIKPLQKLHPHKPTGLEELLVAYVLTSDVSVNVL